MINIKMSRQYYLAQLVIKGVPRNMQYEYIPDIPNVCLA